MKRPRLLFINRSFWPDHEATGQLLTQLCEDLIEDFDIDVICGHSLQGEKNLEDIHPFGPSLNIYRVNHTRIAKGFFLGRLTNLLTFTASAYRVLKQVPIPDVVITETDPFFLPLLGRTLKKRTGCKFIAYLQDIYPDVAVVLGKFREGYIVRKLRNLLFNCYQQADRVIVLSDDMKKTCQQNGIPDSALQVLPNWTDTTTIYPVKKNNYFRKEHGWDDKFIVMYSGNLGLANEINALLDAANLLKNHHNIHFVVIGDGVQKKAIVKKIATDEINNITMLQKQPYENLSESLSAADLHYVSLKSGVERCLYPSKVYGILASGTPLLVLAKEASDLSQFVENQELGKVCDIDQSHEKIMQSLTTAILSLAKDKTLTDKMGAKARLVAEQKFDRCVITNQFAEAVTETMNHRDSEIKHNENDIQLSIH